MPFGFMTSWRGLLTVAWIGLACSPGGATPRAPAAPTPTLEHLTVHVRASWPHDPEAFTQGLVWSEGVLYESLGLYGHSALRRVEIESGRPLLEVRLPDDMFAEGLARVGGRLVQLTWKEKKAFVYGLRDFRRLAELPFPGEGWGLTYDGRHLISSDGSDTLTFRDPATLAPLRTLKVTLQGQARDYLNELEWADGALYANVWQDDTLLRIDPASGRVTATIDGSGLLSLEERRNAEVLNGIAYDPARRVFYLTGKLWPKLFEVEFTRK